MDDAVEYDSAALLAARIAALEDVEAIEALKARYWRAIDRKRPDEAADCLTADAVIDFEGLPRYEGRAGFISMVRQAAGRAQAFDMHHGQNPRITLTGADTAAGEWEIFYYGIDGAACSLVQMAGVYHDMYRREEGVWRIAATEMRMTCLVVAAAGPGRVPVLSVLGAVGPR